MDTSNLTFSVQMCCVLKRNCLCGSWFVCSTSSILNSVTRVGNSRSLSWVKDMLAPCGERGEKVGETQHESVNVVCSMHLHLWSILPVLSRQSARLPLLSCDSMSMIRSYRQNIYHRQFENKLADIDQETNKHGWTQVAHFCRMFPCLVN